MARRGYRAMLLAAALAACVPILPAAAQERAAWAPEMSIDDYAWIDRADVLSGAIGEAPPDHGFVHDGGEPWAWLLEDGSLVVSEQREDGLHSYYFDPEATAPFLVRDPEMSFAFVHGQVAVVYDAEGGVLSREEGGAWLDEAARGHARGRALHRAWRRRDERPVAASAWIDFGIFYHDWNQRWEEGKRRHHRWRRWRERRDAIEHRRRRHAERRHRDELAELFRRWRDGNWHGSPPGQWRRPPVGWRPRGPGNWGRPAPEGSAPPPAGQPDTHVPRRGDGEGVTPRPRWDRRGTGGVMRPRDRETTPRPVEPPLTTGTTPVPTPRRAPGVWGRIEGSPAPGVPARPLAERPAHVPSVTRSAPPVVRAPSPPPAVRPPTRAPTPRSEPRGTWGKLETDPD